MADAQFLAEMSSSEKEKTELLRQMQDDGAGSYLFRLMYVPLRHDHPPQLRTRRDRRNVAAAAINIPAASTTSTATSDNYRTN